MCGWTTRTGEKKMELKYGSWSDAKRMATEFSMRRGHAWIVKSGTHFKVISSGKVEDAPEKFSAEFKDGIEQ
jgi:hypothetical protein